MKGPENANPRENLHTSLPRTGVCVGGGGCGGAVCIFPKRCFTAPRVSLLGLLQRLNF